MWYTSIKLVLHSNLITIVMVRSWMHGNSWTGNNLRKTMKGKLPKGGGVLGGGNIKLDVKSSRNYPRKSEINVLFIISYGPLILRPPFSLASKTTCKHRIRRITLIFHNPVLKDIIVVSEFNSNIICNCLLINNTFNELL